MTTYIWVNGLFKELRPVLEGFVVPMHEGSCENRKLNPEGFIPRDLTHCLHKPECIGTTNPDRLVLITWHFQLHPVNVNNLHLKENMCFKWEPLYALLPSLHHVVPLNDGNCRLTIPIVKGSCAHEALPHAFNIGVFKCGKSNPTTIKHIYNESENLNESCDVAFAFDSNN